ncbi:hypothetical protein M0657_006665 [Pyricularia oryzae]|nr:hypothetical protein OOU_Y34scaffold00206g5 [Pyricularia oryzae Y34]KAI7918121.1 hypothetical protein M9X92_007031 [Pyricularia oryzae]KAI7920316.1 hypothetical protein M0657_006665 [Pyricularia oryzae]
MCAKKTTKKSKSTRQDAAPSNKQKPAEVIELSSDSDSDVSSIGGDGQEEQPEQQPLATPATKRKAPQDVAGEDGDAPASSSASKRQRKLAVRVKQGGASGAGGGEAGKDNDGVVVRKTHLEISAPAAALSSARKPEAASTHVRFGEDDDDSNDKFFTPMERPTKKNLFDAAAKKAQAGEEKEEDSDDESGSDDDAPPEAVSSHAAAHQINDLAKQAAKAAEQQAASERLKRQRRDALFKTQARKRALDEAESSAAPKAAAPALLPAEFLESDDESDVDDDEESRKVEVRKPKKIKFETAERRAARQEGRGVADRRDGDTVYKVVRPLADTRLAPRASKRAAFDKKKLLSRGRVEVRKKGGFLLK